MTQTLGILIALLLQSFPMAPLAPRNGLQNPSTVSAVPKKLQKDYDKMWARFVKGNQDASVIKDSDKLLKKNRDFVQLIIVEAYIDLYNARPKPAEARMEHALSLEPRNRIALSYLAEFAFARQDYARANELYSLLIDADPSHTDVVETKRQKALLLATEDLLRRASKAEQENRITEAESLYLQALQIAPREPSFHERLGVLFTEQKKWDDALEHFRKERELGGPADETDRHIAETLASLGRTSEAREIMDRLPKSRGRDEAANSEDALPPKVNELENIGRWGKDIGIFHKIESAPELSREQLAAVIVRYFPQVADLRRTSQIVTDIQDSWARAEIQIVAGIGVLEPRPNHTFQPQTPLTRAELARVLARLASLLGVSLPTAPAIPTADISSGNATYREVQTVVGNGLMALDGAGNFNASGRVSGEESVRAIDRLLQLSRRKNR